MSITEVETAADLEAIPGRDREAVATLLSEGAPSVVWIERWLCDSKDLHAAENHPQLVVSQQVTNYSEKAYKVRQITKDGGETTDYVPKSASEAFVLADGVDTVDTPQSGLGEFEP